MHASRSIVSYRCLGRASRSHALRDYPTDDDFATRIKAVKKSFCTGAAANGGAFIVRMAKGERGIWQRRFWERAIRDEGDYARHLGLRAFQPVKHGYVSMVAHRDAISKRRNEAIELLMTEFDSRFSFENGRSDVSESYGTYIRHRESGLRVFNVRRYKGFGNWLEELGFQTILEKTQIQANHAGTGYILAKRLAN